MEEESPSLLSVVLDVNPVFWGQFAPRNHIDMETKEKYSVLNDLPSSFQRRFGQLSLTSFVESLLVMFNVFLNMNNGNEVALVACHTKQTPFILPCGGGSSASSSSRHRSYVVRRSLLDLLEKHTEDEMDSYQPLFSAALSRVLTFINRKIHQSEIPLSPRILVVSVSPDPNEQYVPLMNCFFSAEKLGVPVDVLMANRSDSLFFQQASDLTSGIYRVAPEFPYLPFLMSTYLVGVELRKSLMIPQQRIVDYRAACFCHHRVLDSGFVCCVCFSVFCSYTMMCTTCGARFPLPKLSVLKKGKAKAKAKAKAGNE